MFFFFCLFHRFWKYFVHRLLLYKKNHSWKFCLFSGGCILSVLLEIIIMILSVKMFWWHFKFGNGWIVFFLARRKYFNPLLNQNASFSDFGHNILRGSFNHAKLMQWLFIQSFYWFRKNVEYTGFANIVILFAQIKLLLKTWKALEFGRKILVANQMVWTISLQFFPQILPGPLWNTLPCIEREILWQWLTTKSR